jgi:RimJ/RimL family protein N-acetyltransferase
MRFPEDVPTLTDGVVTLRAPQESDVAGVVEQCRDPESVRWTTVPLGYTEAEARAYLHDDIPDWWRRDTEYVLVVEADRDGVPSYAGNSGLRVLGDRRGDVGFGASAWVRRRGLTERAVRLLLRWAFDEVGLEVVEWWAHEGNWASRRLAWRVGFSFDGTVRRHLVQRGELRDGWVGTIVTGEPLEPRHPWLDVPVVHGDRVRLRPLRPSDDDRVVEACSDPLTSEWLGQMPVPYTHADAATWRHQSACRAADGTAVVWAVADEADVLVGAVNLFDVHAGRSAELGYWTHPDARGKGLTVEACGLALRHAFLPADVGALGLERVYAYAGVDNVASCAVLSSAGLVEQGLARNTVLTRRGLEDAYAFDIVREEWESDRTG